MGIQTKVFAPLALSFMTAILPAQADPVSEAPVQGTFHCDAPDLSGLPLPTVLDVVMPSNVFIKTSALQQSAPDVVPQDVPDGDVSPQIEVPPQNALGSGFIIDPSGYILTNYHVIEGADTITVSLYDQNAISHVGKSVEATLIGADDKLDLAVLKVSMDTPLPCVILGNSDELKRGQNVYPIGNPLGKPFRVSAGIVSHPAEEVRNPLYSYIGRMRLLTAGTQAEDYMMSRGTL